MFLENNCSFKIGNECSFSHDDEILCQEDNASIVIGSDCMFSHHINIRTSDAHTVYDLLSKKRVNEAKGINRQSYVDNCNTEMLQCNGCIVGTCSIVNHRIEETEILCNAVIVGQPAK